MENWQYHQKFAVKSLKKDLKRWKEDKRCKLWKKMVCT